MNNAKLSNIELINVLRANIITTLGPLFSKKCILLDAPYYHNIGDVLIWAGEKAFIEEIGSECIYTASYDTCTYPEIDEDVTILFQGGGNIGDLYHVHPEFLLKIVKRYPRNRIIVCPQSVYYQDSGLEEKDLKELATHDDLYFCGRDTVTVDLLKKYIGDHALCLPDMAFCIPLQDLNVFRRETTLSHLYIERTDCEKADIIIDANVDKRDWPVFEDSLRKSTFFNKILTRFCKMNLTLLNSFLNSLWDHYAQTIFFKGMLREGVEFISPYKHVSTTRLHGCILAILLDKQITFIDNSYGKNRRFYETWLTKLETLNFQGQD